MKNRKSKTLAQGYSQMRESESALMQLSSTASRARSQMKRGNGARPVSPSRAKSTVESSRPSQAVSATGGGASSFTFDSIDPKVFGYVDMTEFPSSFFFCGQDHPLDATSSKNISDTFPILSLDFL